MCIERACRRSRMPRGFTLIELVIFIVIVGVGVVGILSVLNLTARNSADPLIRKQMLAIAEGLIEEVELMPFTYCDPTDANAASAASTVLCATTVETMGPDVGEIRTSVTNPFNNVNDYFVVTIGYVLSSPITDITGNPPTAPVGYSARIDIFAEPLHTITPVDASPANMNSLRIAVTVSHGADSLTLEGYRTRHSPNFTP